MKNSKIKLLTATACLALVGTASAAWVYAGTATESANIGVKVASYASAGSIEISGADNVYVYLDKDSVTFKKTDSNVKLAATYTAPSGLTLDTTNYELQLTYQVVISDNLSNVIQFGTGVTTESSTNTKATDWSRTWTSDEDVFSSLPSLKWNDNFTADLSNEDQYKTVVGSMIGESTTDYSWYDQNKEWTATEDLHVTLTFKAEVVAKA